LARSTRLCHRWSAQCSPSAG